MENIMKSQTALIVAVLNKSGKKRRGLSTAEIAKRTNLSRQAVARRMYDVKKIVPVTTTYVVNDGWREARYHTA